MINARKALADLEATPGDIVAVTKAQMAELLRELAQRQPSAHDLTFLRVASPQPARAAA